MADEGDRFPFRFYGANPSDWFEPEAPGFAYELRFRAAPPAAERATLAADFARALGARAEASPLWLWAGAWALLRVRPRPSKRAGAPAAFAAAAEALRRLHAGAALEQAVLLEALEAGDDPWDAWTLGAHPAPEPGPRWPHPVTLDPGAERPDLPIEGAGAQPLDGALDGGNGEGLDDESDESDDESDGDGDGDDDDESDGDGDGDESDEPADGGEPSSRGGERGESLIAPGRVTLAPLGAAPRRPRARAAKVAPPQGFGEGEALGTTPGGLVYGWSKRAKRRFDFAWLEGDELRTCQLTAASPERDVVLRDDGRAALVAPSDKGELWVVSFDDGVARQVFRHPDGEDESLYNPTWLGQDRVAASDFGSVFVVALEGDGAGRLEKRIGGASPDSMCAALGGRALLVGDTDGDAGLSVVGVGPASFKLLARFDGDFEVESAEGERPIVRDEDGERFELCGLDGAHRAAFEGGAPEFVDAPEYAAPEGEDYSTPHAPGRVGLSRRRGDERPEPPALPENAAALFGDTSYVLPGPAGGAFGFVRKPGRRMQFGYLEGDDVRTVALSHPRYGAAIAGRPDGGAALTTGPERDAIAEVAFADGTVSALASGLPYQPDGLAYLAGGDVAALADDSLYLLRRREGKLEQSARLAAEGSKLFAALGGRVLVISGWQDPSLRAYGVAGDEVRLLGGFGPTIDALFEREGRVYVRAESGGDLYEIVGLDEAHRAAFAGRDDEAYPPLAPPAAPSDDDDDDGDGDGDDSDDESDDETPKRPPGAYAVDAAPGRVGLRYLADFEPPDDPDAPREAAALFGRGSDTDYYRGTLYGWKKEARRAYRFAFWRGGAFAETKFTTPAASNACMALRDPDHGAALVGLDGDTTLWRVDADTGEGRKLWTTDEGDELYRVDFLAEGHYVAICTDSVYVLAPEGEGARPLARLGINAVDVIVSPDGRAFALEGASGEGLWVIGLGGGRLKALLRLAEAGVNNVRAEGDQALVELDDDAWYELTGVAEAWRSAFEGGGAFDDPPLYVAPSDDESGDDESDDDESDESDESDDDESGDDESDESGDDESDDDD